MRRFALTSHSQFLECKASNKNVHTHAKSTYSYHSYHVRDIYISMANTHIIASTNACTHTHTHTHTHTDTHTQIFLLEILVKTYLRKQGQQDYEMCFTELTKDRHTQMHKQTHTIFLFSSREMKDNLRHDYASGH